MNYICKNRHGTYYARFVIPTALREQFKNKREIRYSLKTDSRKQAIINCRRKRVEFDEIIEGMKHNKVVTHVMNKIVLNNNTSEEIVIDYGDDSEKELKVAMALQGTGQTTETPETSDKTKITEHLADYIDFQTSTAINAKPKWNKAGAGRLIPPKLRFFCDTIKGIPTTSITWGMIDDYIEIAHALPKNYNHNGHADKFKEITLDMLLDNDSDTDLESRKPSAVKADFKAVIAFLRWVKKRKKIESLAIPIDSLDTAISDIKYESSRREFTQDELKVLFESNNPANENYIKGFNSTRGLDSRLKYWLPLLGLYTGATLAELSQLLTSDIKEHQGFWVIDVNEDGEKRLKNKYRQRYIPIHNTLIDLEFLEYVKSQNNIKLFPTAQRKNGSFGTESQWFGDYSDKAGITDSDVVFHSFRHNLCSTLANKHTAESLVTAISGHSYSSTAKTTYYRGDKRSQEIKPLADVINEIDYGLNHPKFKALE